MRDAVKGLTTLLATLKAQKSRGWTAHNEFDYFTLCPTCGHWFDCRNPENLIKHQHPVAASIVVTTTIAQTSSEQISGLIVHSSNPPTVAIETPDPLPDTPGKP